jgi:hypothetical protein
LRRVLQAFVWFTAEALDSCAQNYDIRRSETGPKFLCPPVTCMFGLVSKNVLLGIAIILVFMIAISSVLYRLVKAKPLLQPDFPDSRFTETWCSGQSDRNSLARLVGAKNFLWITVTKDHVHVSPHSPFNLMFLPEAFGWDHRVPGKTIIDVREVSYGSHGHGALIRYRHATGDEEWLELQVSDVPALMRALADIRAP